MNFSKIDIFSSPFQFDFGNQVKRKGTIYGAILSLFLVIVIVIYSIYLFYLYFNNQINPNFASQNFVSEDTIDLELSEELVGFRYEYGVNLNLDDLQTQKNKTYLVFAPYFYYQIGTYFQMIPLNYTKCKSSQLQGFNCFDFSTVKNYTLTLSTSQNFFSNVYLFVYKCSDTDQFNSYIPNNCVDDDADYNSVINNSFADLRLKQYTSQYNTTSQKMQVNYRNSYVYLQGNSFQYYDYKIQKQITNVKDGAIVQYESAFSSPIQYVLKTISIDRQSFFQSTNQTCLLQITLEVDEIIEYVQIQYTTFTQILSQCNSALALLMCLGFLGRKFSLKLMREDLFLLLLQNMFHGTYQTILKKKNYLEDKNNICFENAIQQTEEKIDPKEDEEKMERSESVAIPSFLTKSIKQVDQQSNFLQTGELMTEIQNTCKDEVLEFEIQKKPQFEKNALIFDNQLTNNLRRDQLKKKISNSPLLKKAQIEIQNFNSQECQNQKDQELIQESLFLVSDRSGFSKKSQFIQTDRKQIQEKNTDNLKAMQGYYIKRAKTIQDKSILKNVHSKIFQLKCFNQSDYQQLQGLDPEEKLVIENHINESLDILQIYRDLILLKKAIMILFSKEQLAALQLIGISSEFLKSVNKFEQSGQQKEEIKCKQISFFEEQYSILQRSDLQEKYVNSFFLKIQNGERVTEVDQRILSSLK